jgi:hypothetical protein
VDAGTALAAFGDFARARLATPTTLIVVGAERQDYARTAMRLAAERGQSFLDEATVQAAVDELGAST